MRSNLELLPLVAEVIALFPEGSGYRGGSDVLGDSKLDSKSLAVEGVLLFAFGFLSAFVHENKANQSALFELKHRTLYVWIGAGVGQDMLLAEVSDAVCVCLR